MFNFETIIPNVDNFPYVAEITYDKNGLHRDYSTLKVDRRDDLTMRVSCKYNTRLRQSIIIEVDEGNAKKEIFRVDPSGDGVSLGMSDDEATWSKVYHHFLDKTLESRTQTQMRKDERIQYLFETNKELSKQIKFMEDKLYNIKQEGYEEEEAQIREDMAKADEVDLLSKVKDRVLPLLSDLNEIAKEVSDRETLPIQETINTLYQSIQDTDAPRSKGPQ